MILIDAHNSRVRPYFGALIEPSWRCRQVVVFERLEMPAGNLGLVRDGVDRQSAVFASVPEQLAETGAAQVAGSGRKGVLVDGMRGGDDSHGLLS